MGHELAISLIAVALGERDLEKVAAAIPSDARFDVRRDVEYLATEDCHPNYAAPHGEMWERTGDEEPILSEWDADGETMVRAYRWDARDLSLSELEDIAFSNGWDGRHWEMLAGYLDYGGIFPAASEISGGESWNTGYWSPVFIVADYVILR